MKPEIHPEAVVIGNVYISGNVKIAKGAFILPFCSIRGDIEPIIIGEGSNVQDNVVMHTAQGAPCVVGKNVSIGHCAVIHGAEIGDDCIIGMNTTVLSGAKIGPGCVIGANALVKENDVIPENSLAVGIPAKVIRTIPVMKEAARKNAQEYHRLRDEYKKGKHVEHLGLL